MTPRLLLTTCIHFVSAKEQQSELRAAEASRRLGALDLRTSAAGSPGSPSMALLGFATCSSFANTELFTWQCGTGILLHTIKLFFCYVLVGIDATSF